MIVRLAFDGVGENWIWNLQRCMSTYLHHSCCAAASGVWASPPAPPLLRTSEVVQQTQPFTVYSHKRRRRNCGINGSPLRIYFLSLSLNDAYPLCSVINIDSSLLDNVHSKRWMFAATQLARRRRLAKCLIPVTNASSNSNPDWEFSPFNMPSFHRRIPAVVFPSSFHCNPNTQVSNALPHCSAITMTFHHWTRPPM